MKILHVIVGLYTGGAEGTLCKLLERSTRERFEHCVVTLLRGGEFRERARDAGARLYELGLRRNRLPMAAAATLVRLVRKERPDLVQGWMYHGNTVATLVHLSSLRRLPLLWGIHHSLDDLASERPLTRRLIALGARTSGLTSGIVYVSKASALQHEGAGYNSGRTVIIPNGFDCETFRPRAAARERLVADLRISADAVIVGMVARHHPLKDHANLIRAAAMAAKNHPLHLVLIGQGVTSENAALTTALDAAGLRNCTSLLGERADIPDLVAGFDMFALSSRSEAFPQVLGEAMASGIPCVATDVGECQHVLADTGLAVRPEDSEALAAALTQMIAAGAEGRRQLGARARDRVLKHWSLVEIVRSHERLFEQVATGNR